ncbi:DUF1760-domain-containing protein [Aaosphaeria arxii CBS 175.79]|uniref:DUF1760-domain-containing protein n=1 Tax=Aaosphaeria arxii CBS 175.79 TaxID=1450172 RepID=A0A6A5XQ50_9PLEO|nr:DUF1760-domain-containing protein [Aaosphaeria arxii CBS 175.79]KAF2015019.1 DUF1760-domain-containing protein [Aaosphaeria arxii CBS 175.79]
MAEVDKEQNPLLAALPPATDYLTYLTLIEYNLTEENLPVLHQVLQDTELTINIGWDLIHLLLPLLPASEECLQDVAARGNPRECILKVTEALRLLRFEEREESDDEVDLGAEESSSKAAPVAIGESSLSPALPRAEVPPHSVLRFEVLLSLLATLHKRIKTKYPSRFLSTSLQAVLAAYDEITTHRDELTLATVKFVKEISGKKRPHLPPRTSSGNILRTGTGFSEPDPEAQADPPTADENTLSNRLLQSFVTHVLKDYIFSLFSDEDVPGLAWSSRLMEKFEPHRLIPNKTTYADRFAEQEEFTSRTAIVGQLVALAQDLGLSDSDLTEAIYDESTEKAEKVVEEDEPPASAKDIPLSKTGSLLLHSARTIKQELYATTAAGDESVLPIFPDHASLLQNFVGINGLQNIGNEPEALLDALLSLGLIALEKNNVGEPTDDEHFTKYLQLTSLISANSPSPSLRYHAHYLTSTVLRSHPSDLVRLTFIRDTLEHCPYENLKASAVGWLKGDTLEANIPHGNDSSESSSPSIFATPVALQTVSPFLFPDPTKTWASSEDVTESWTQFRLELGFYLASLNFYYLLLSAKQLHGALDIPGLHKQSLIEDGFINPLKDAVKRFKDSLADGGRLAISEGEENVEAAKADIARLEDVLERVDSGVQSLGKA